MPLISYPLQNERREAVRQLVDAFVGIWAGSDYGPAHIALSDYNLLDDNLDFCLQRTLDAINGTSPDTGRNAWEGHSRNELEATVKLIDCLRLIPEEWRDIHAEAIEED